MKEQQTMCQKREMPANDCGGRVSSRGFGVGGYTIGSPSLIRS